MTQKPKTSGGGTFTPITSGLVGWWKMTEGSGIVSTADSSGFSNSALLIASPTWISGVPGSPVSPYALSLNGTTQYLSVSSLSNAISAPCFMSFTCWIYTNSTYSSTYNGIIINRTKGLCGLDISNATNNMLTTEWNNTEYGTNTGLTIPSNGSWTFIAGVITSTGATTYVNGGRSTNFESCATQQNGGAWTFGWDPAVVLPNRLWQGGIADIRLYNRSLSSTEISTIYNLQG